MSFGHDKVLVGSCIVVGMLANSGGFLSRLVWLSRNRLPITGLDGLVCLSAWNEGQCMDV